MTSIPRQARFDGSLGCLVSPHVETLATQLSSVPRLSDGERCAIAGALRHALTDNLRRRLERLLALELNAARVEGRLQGATAEARWDEFIGLSSQMAFWTGVSEHYPTLLARVDALCRNQAASALSFARRWAEERAALASLCGGVPGEIAQIKLGAGDTHRGGATVAIVSFEGGAIVYKPRSVAPEKALAGFLAWLGQATGLPLDARVPKVIDLGDHGWAGFTHHRYAASDDETRRFYRAIGHWIAIMRLIGGTDFHAENLIACGPSPVIVDAETLFTPDVPPLPQGLGAATDFAVRLVSGSVLATGLLPRRGSTLGWRGVDMSGVGSVPDQQPVMMMPDIVGTGTDTAKFGLTPGRLLPLKNHPSAQPSLVRHWPNVFRGFQEMTEALRALDRGGALAPALERFRDCPIRVIVRPTEVYAQLGGMLWHPVSLHDEAKAKARAGELMRSMADNVAIAPSDPAVIGAEIGDLLTGDVPFFETTPRDGRLHGPGGTSWLAPADLVDGALANWRGADFALESNYVRTTLVSAYVSDDIMAQGASITVATARGDDLDRRRRAQAAIAMRKLMATAVRGDDGTVSWVAPTLTPGGLAVQVLASDAYGGLSGISLATAAYVKEMRAGRADAIEALEPFLAAIHKTLHLADEKHARLKTDALRRRPAPLSAYVGIGSHIWRHLALEEWSLGDGNGLAVAIDWAQEMPDAASYDDRYDILTGRAGAIPALLALARETGSHAFVDMAHAMGDEICARVVRDGNRAWWVHEQWPRGLGGFAHGATGIGWSLAKLADVTQDATHHEIARAAFAFEDSLFDADERGWLDLRDLGGPKTGCAWCHGAVGIGLARLDLDRGLAHESTRQTLGRAAKAAWLFGLGSSHCACHGSVGIWELLDAAIAHGEGPGGLSREAVLAMLITSLEDSGPSFGMLKEAFIPSLMLGLAGVVYQLLRADPRSALPSFLMLEGLCSKRRAIA